MTEDRLSDLMLWRDAFLIRSRGSEAAGRRLAAFGSVSEVIARADTIEAPDDEERQWTDLNGEPVDPGHPWWSEQRLSLREINAIRKGTYDV